MGYRLALFGAIVAMVVAGVAALGQTSAGSDAVGTQAQAASAQASAAKHARRNTSARRKLNRFRARHGLRRLRYSRSLARSARRQARYMARHGFGHLSTIRASRAFRSLAEIILKHRGAPRARTAIKGWAHSPAHRSVMLSGRYGKVGIGKVTRGGATYWVAHMGRL